LLLALLVLLALLGLGAAARRVLRKPPQALTPMDRFIGYLLLGKFFPRLHARFHARADPPR